MQLRNILIAIVVLLTAFSADAAKPLAKKKQPAKLNAEELMERAAADFAAYRFDAVLEAIATLDSRDALDLRRRAELGSNMLGRVEQVAIIDSIVLPKSGIMPLLPLSSECGTLFTAGTAVIGQPCVAGSGAFASADGRTLIWSMPDADSDSSSHLVASYRLVDGTIEPAEDLGEQLHVGRFVGYPYLMPDGVTLYFAADGEGSLGGLDIFMSRSNGSDFLQPQNLGMPYNSPFDDYMMAIDESTGYGFWLTDRNQIADSVTLYMFRVNDLRRNYPVDSPDLADHARITSVAATPGVSDPMYMKAYQKPDRGEDRGLARSGTSGYAIAVPGRGVITSASQVSTQIGLDALSRYVGAKQQYDNTLSELNELRRAFADGDTSVSHRILTLEHDIPALEKLMLEASNAVIRAESPTSQR